MSIQHVFGITWTGGSAPSVSDRLTQTGTVAVEADFTVVGAQTDQVHNIGFDKDALKGIVIIVSGNATQAVHLETNAADHTGGQEIVFPAGGGRMLWDNTSPLTNPITDDVTNTYWTHSGSETVTVTIRVLV